MKLYRFSTGEIDSMKKAVNDAVTAEDDRIHLCFALGKALEDAGEHQDAFAYYKLGNDLKRSALRYDGATMRQSMALQKEFCNAALFEKFEGAGYAAPDPIFIVGLPRAGSMLIEQILASHSAVDGTMELANIPALAHRLNGRRHVDEPPQYPENLSGLDREELKKFGDAYIANTAVHRAGAPFFIDKMPNNFRHLGLIRLILPNAKIIDARREPMACCFSGYKQLFAEGQEFTYGLGDIGAYYRDYVELMRHWEQMLPGWVLRVQHEDLLNDLEGQVRRLLDFCQLPFEPACLEFHKTARAVRTASSEQVRQPITKGGVDQWRAFDAYLAPLKEALGEAISDYKQ